MMSTPAQEPVCPKEETSERTGEARLELFIHHRVDNALDVSRVWVSSAVVDGLLVDDIVRRMAGLAGAHTETVSWKAHRYEWVL